MKRTIRTRGGRHAVAFAPGKGLKQTVRGAALVEHDAELSRLKRLSSMVHWVSRFPRPDRDRKNPIPSAYSGRVAPGERPTDVEPAAHAVRRSRATLQSMIDAVDDMIAMVNPDGVILAINRAGAEGFGGQPRDLVGRSLPERFQPEPSARLREIIAAVLAGEQRTQMEFGWRDRWLHLTAHPVINNGGAPAAVSLFSRDITERVHAEEEAREHQNQLMRYMRIATMGEMSAALAHELNQPIAAIVNYCTGSLRRLASGRWTVDDLRGAIDETCGEAKRAREIIQNVARFVRKAPRQRESVEIGALVGPTESLIRKDLERHGMELVVDLADPAAPVTVNVVEIEQTLLNLLRNSMESIAEAQPPERRIVLRVRVQAGALRIAVRDTGAGFSAETAAHAFDPFFTTKAEGMGMGLAICRTIVEDHGGRIWAEPRDALSFDGGGIYLTLPLDEASNAAA